MNYGDIPGWLGLGLGLFATVRQLRAERVRLDARAGLNRQCRTSQHEFLGPKRIAVRVWNVGSQTTTIAGVGLNSPTGRGDKKLFETISGSGTGLPHVLRPGHSWDFLLHQTPKLEAFVREYPDAQFVVLHSMGGRKGLLVPLEQDVRDLGSGELPMPDENGEYRRQLDA